MHRNRSNPLKWHPSSHLVLNSTVRRTLSAVSSLSSSVANSTSRQFIFVDQTFDKYHRGFAARSFPSAPHSQTHHRRDQFSKSQTKDKVLFNLSLFIYVFALISYFLWLANRPLRLLRWLRPHSHIHRLANHKNILRFVCSLTVTPRYPLDHLPSTSHIGVCSVLWACCSAHPVPV